MKLSAIIEEIEKNAPLAIQESYDNSGLIVGEKSKEITSALICLDVTEPVVEEAIRKGCNLIISHHPFIFSGLKKINGQTAMERTLQKVIKQDIAVYAAHTNLDNATEGVNHTLCEKLGLQNIKILSPRKNLLKKLITFCPADHAEKVRAALFAAGAGSIGNYDSCSFNSPGTGTFRANEKANPFVGKINEIHYENEVKIEIIYPSYLENNILNEMLRAHPYEEVAYDIIPLSNEMTTIGSGMTGELSIPESEIVFLQKIKNILHTGCIKHTKLLNKQVRKIAVCGGAGIFLLKDAIAYGADIFITGDVKYHDFFEAENKIVIADAGHYESEQFAKELLYTILNKKFPTFAVQISEVNTNPVNYL